MLERMPRSADEAIHRLLEGAPDLAADARRGPGGAAEVFGLVGPRPMSASVGPRAVGTTLALVGALPHEPLTGELPDRWCAA